MAADSQGKQAGCIFRVRGPSYTCSIGLNDLRPGKLGPKSLGFWPSLRFCSKSALKCCQNLESLCKSAVFEDPISPLTNLFSLLYESHGK